MPAAPYEKHLNWRGQQGRLSDENYQKKELQRRVHNTLAHQRRVNLLRPGGYPCGVLSADTEDMSRVRGSDLYEIQKSDSTRTQFPKSTTNIFHHAASVIAV